MKFKITNPHGTSKELNICRSVVKTAVKHASPKSRVTKVVQVNDDGTTVEYTAEEFMMS
jgi:hypothetical protein